jgi:hypothetical protein
VHDRRQLLELGADLQARVLGCIDVDFEANFVALRQ